MLLTVAQAYELLATRGVFAREVCNVCRQVLGPVRFTRRDRAGEWCSRECRGDAGTISRLRPGRPRKYRNVRDARAAKTAQQRNYRRRADVEKTVCIVAGTKDLQTRKTALSHTPLAETG